MNLFIGGSTSEAIAEHYLHGVRGVVEKIVQYPNIGLVAGDYPRGIMAIPYYEFSKQEKEVIAILDQAEYPQAEVILNSFIRLQKIYEASDIFLFFPGGIETYAMLFSFIQENSQSKKQKKIILYNTDYFFTPVIKELYRLYEDGFITQAPSDYIIIESDENKIIEMIEKENELWKK